MAIDLSKLETADGSQNHLLGLLIEMEDILDSMDLYIFQNWFSGEVVDGPIVRRHWLSFTLLYPHNKMPDPRGAKRLLKHDIIVEYNKVKQNGKDFHPLTDEKSQPLQSPSSEAAHEANPENQFWMVKITFPRRLITQMGADLDFYDDEIDADDIESAKDSGIDNESAYNSDEQEPDPTAGGEQAGVAPDAADPFAPAPGAKPNG
ncbi:unnamed protein product [Sphagnum tenellum]